MTSKEIVDGIEELNSEDEIDYIQLIIGESKIKEQELLILVFGLE